MKKGSAPDILADVCKALGEGHTEAAAQIIRSGYPFAPSTNVGRRYGARECMEVFVRDGFVDRYSGARLVFPGALRLVSLLLPQAFPFHRNWKTDACHQAYWQLFPTIDHIVPVSRGGADEVSNWACTSMLRNSAKANFTLEELGWALHPPGALADWDGLTTWFLAYAAEHADVVTDSYLRAWLAAARAVPLNR